MGSDIFISYTRKDQSFADALVQHLEQKDINCWIDHRDILAGSSWAEDIDEAIKGNPGLVIALIFSANTNASDQVIKELNLAGSYKIPVIPIRIENVMPLGHYAYHLGTVNWMNVFGEENKNLDQVAERVKDATLRLRSRKGFVGPDGKITNLVQSLPSVSTLSANEQKYIAKLKIMLEDKQIDADERKRLEDVREALDITSEQAAQLEEQIKLDMGLIKRPFTSNEEKFFAKLKLMLEDRQIDAEERKRLEDVRDALDIEPQRASELEELAKKELGLLEQPVEPSQEEASKALSETIANKLTEELNARYSQVEQKLNFSFQTDWRGWGFFIVADIYIGPVSFQLVGYCNNDAYGVEFWDVGVKYVVREWVESSIKADFSDLEINMRKSYGFVGLWYKDRETGALAKSNEQLMEDFKSGVFKIYDRLFPKLTDLYDKKINSINKVQSLSKMITQRLEKEFITEEGWIVENGIKYLGESEGIAVHHADWNNKISLRLEADHANFNELFVGLRKGECQLQYKDGAEEQLKKQFDQIFAVQDTSSNSNEWWVAWDYMDEHNRQTTTENFFDDSFAYLLDTPEKEEALINAVVEKFVKMKNMKGLIDKGTIE